MPQRGVGGDAGAQERRRFFRAQPLGNPHDIALIDDDLGGVSAVGGCDAVPLFAVIGEGEVAFAILLQAFLAGLACPAGTDEAADPHGLTGGELFDGGLDFIHRADDFMSRHYRKERSAPFIPRLVHIRMANPTVLAL